MASLPRKAWEWLTVFQWRSRLFLRLADKRPARLWISRREARELYQLCEGLYGIGRRSRTQKRSVKAAHISKVYHDIKDHLGIKIVKE